MKQLPAATGNDTGESCETKSVKLLAIKTKTIILNTLKGLVELKETAESGD